VSVCVCALLAFLNVARYFCVIFGRQQRILKQIFYAIPPLVKKSSLLQQQNSCEQQPTHMRCLALARSGPPKECESGRATETERE